jgi:hypothetical protein
LSKKPYESQPVKKIPHADGIIIFNFFATKDFYKKDDVQQKYLLEDLTFLIIKNHLPMHLVENQWLKKLNLHLCPRVVLFCRKQFSRICLPKLVAKTKQLYVLLALGKLLLCKKFSFVNVKRGI